MSHVTHQHVMSHTNKHHLDRHGCEGPKHVTYKWVMSHINESCHTWIRIILIDTDIQDKNVLYINESCHTSTSYVTNERTSPWSTQIYKTKTCHICMSHVKHQRVMSHLNEHHLDGHGCARQKRVSCLQYHRAAEHLLDDSRRHRRTQSLVHTHRRETLGRSPAQIWRMRMNHVTD